MLATGTAPPQLNVAQGGIVVVEQMSQWLVGHLIIIVKLYHSFSNICGYGGKDYG